MKRLVPFVLVAVIAAIYWPVFHAGFIWDDDASVTANALIIHPGGLGRIWFSAQPADYWPVSATSLWLEWRLWGAHAGGYHATNLVLFAAAVLILWRLLRELAIPGAFIGALLFALHPVNVESVAWISQRKNLLALLFGLLSVLAYWRNERNPSPRTRAASLAAFVLALLSKGSVAPLPLVLLGLILWRRRPTREDARRLLPFFAVAAALAAVNVWFQSHGLGDPVRTATWLQRLLGAAAAVWFYLWKALLPVHLSLAYPLWSIQPETWRWWLPLIAALLVTAALAAGARVPSIRPYLAAWLFFVVMLIPVLGFTDIAFMQYSLVADHYQQWALVGMAALAGFILSRFPSLGALAAVVLAMISFNQAATYRNSRTVWEAVLQQNPHSWIAEQNLGIDAERHGDLAMAMTAYGEAVAFHPDFAAAQYNLGRLEAQKGDLIGAAGHFGAAARLAPHFVDAWVNWGSALLQTGKVGDAIDRYEHAIALDPRHANAHEYLGIALAQSGRLPEAIEQFGVAVRLDPASEDAKQNLADAVRAAGRR